MSFTRKHVKTQIKQVLISNLNNVKIEIHVYVIIHVFQLFVVKQYCEHLKSNLNMYNFSLLCENIQ